MKTPFTSEQFFGVFEEYNSNIFPAQLILISIVIALLAYVVKSQKPRFTYIYFFLAFCWIWAGLIYHILFFAPINKAAYGFGTLFIIQGLLFLLYTLRNKIHLNGRSSNFRLYTGYFFILFGLIIYPLIGYLLESNPQHVITVGLPCPTTIITFGFLLTTRVNVPKYLLIIPSLWALIGISAALNFNIYPDYVMPLAVIIYILFRVETLKTGQFGKQHELKVDDL